MSFLPSPALALVSGAALLLSPAPVSAGSVIFVDASASPGGDGSSWATAYEDLHDALDDVAPGGAIWVAAGTYAPAAPNGSRDASFALVSGAALYGGFAGGEQSLDERDWIVNETILSGDLNGNDGPGFTGTGENSHHVLTAFGVTAATLDGFSVTAGNGDGAGEPRGAGLFIDVGGDLAVRNCTFHENEAMTGASFSGGGGIFCSVASVTMEGCTFRGNRATHGGGVRAHQSGVVTLLDCEFRDNSADVGGGMDIQDSGSVSAIRCRFVGNVVEGGGGGGFCFNVDVMNFDQCEFRENGGTPGGSGGGLIASGDTLTVIDCTFAANFIGFTAGGLGCSASDATIVNSVFSRNSATLGGGMYCNDSTPTIVNCTFSQNAGGGAMGDWEGGAIANCIFWGNSEGQIVQDPSFPGTFPTVSFSNVQGGWPGTGNIDADPIFVQAGADNVRLSTGSPCLDVGDNAAIPAGIVTDLDGNPRIQNGVVDLGAYEGEHGEPLPATAGLIDLDGGEFAILALDGVGLDPMNNPTLMIANNSGEDNASITVTEMDDGQLTGAGGFTNLAQTLAIETSMPDGAFWSRLFIPFDGDDVEGVDPLDVDSTTFADAVGTWALSVYANTQSSPGHPWPIGDRIAVTGPGDWGTTSEPGDYGVYWDPELQQGFVWANLDHAGAFALGSPRCASDCDQPPDGFTGFDDLLAVLQAWNTGAGPFDVDGDGVVGVLDVVDVLSGWGGCE